MKKLIVIALLFLWTFSDLKSYINSKIQNKTRILRIVTERNGSNLLTNKIQRAED